jgi:hypothetical protein
MYSYKVKWDKNKLIIKEYKGKSYDKADYQRMKRANDSNYERRTEE